MPRILGIDPGSRITGFGVIDVDPAGTRYVTSGCVRATGEDLASRLHEIFRGIGEIVDTHRPQQMAIERVFMHRNADSALKLGQARGAAICAATSHAISVTEYAPREIKQAVVGTGSAAKHQVQHMVCALLGLAMAPQADAADALAVALCHGHVSQTLGRAGLKRGRRR